MNFLQRIKHGFPSDEELAMVARELGPKLEEAIKNHGLVVVAPITRATSATNHITVNLTIQVKL